MADTASIFSRHDSHTGEEVVGLSVEDVRGDYGVVLSIPEGATAMVVSNGEPPRLVAEDYELQPGDELTFSVPVGAKG